MTFERDAPRFKSFILPDGTIKLHGVTSEEGLRNALDHIMTMASLKNKSFEEPLKVNEIVASVDLEGPVDAKMIYEEFQKEGIIYDPAELPGFILNVGIGVVLQKQFYNVHFFSFDGSKQGCPDTLIAKKDWQAVYNRIKEN